MLTRAPWLFAILLGLSVTALVACSDDTEEPPKDSGPPEASTLDKALPPDQPSTTPDQGPDKKPPPDQGPDQALPPDFGPPPDAGPDLFPVTDQSLIPTGTTCAKANPITLVSGGTKTINGTTVNATNEFGSAITCGTGYTLDGAQVYYQMKLEQGKTYRIQVKPNGWDAALYLFWDKACTPGNINSQCSTLVSDKVQTNGTEILYISPAATKDYILAVDTYSATKTGAFTLTIEDFTPAANSACAKASNMSFSGTKVTVNGDTSKNALNEYGKDVTCGGYSALEGPQLYYKVSLTGAKAYRFTLKPTHAAYMYVFPSSVCGIGTIIDTACKSQGKTGAMAGPISKGTTKELIFKPTNSGDYVIAIDSTSMSEAGPFSLDVEEAVIPGHDSCATAKNLTLAGGKATVQGNSVLASDKVKLTASQCAKSVTAGADLFYAVTVTGGKTYKVSLKPEAGYDPSLYVFTSCTSVGTTCIVGTDTAYSGGAETVKFTAAATATYLIAVDSRHAAGLAYSQGKFTLSVEEFTKPSNDSCASPKTMSWSGSKAVVIGDTFYSKDQYPTVTCGGTLKFDGPQLYYKLNLTGGKKYLATLTPAAGYDASLYAFPSKTSCSAGAISTACKGHVADAGSQGEIESIMMSPGSSGSWTLVADSWDPKAHGTFTLDVQELTKPSNDTCASAMVITFPMGASKLTTSGYTFAATNNVSLSKSDCTKNTTSGPDVFYQLKLEKGKTYKLKLDGKGFNEAMYLFTSCTYVSSTCNSGMGADLSTTKAEEISITPSATLNYYIAVDGRSSTDSGPYTLTVDRVLLACDVVKKLSFNAGGVASGNGDTASGTTIVDMPATSGCAGTATPGYEHIYSVPLIAGKAYSISVTPSSSYDPVVYVFSDCSKPTSSCVAGTNAIGQGKAEKLMFTPQVSGTYYVAVDAANKVDYGPYILEIK